MSKLTLDSFVRTQSGPYLVPINLIQPNEANPRDTSAYDKGDIRLAKLKTEMGPGKGWKESHPATVHLNDDGTLTLIVGHRRYHAAKQLGIDLVPCVILQGLSSTEILERLMDHATVVGLTEPEQLQAYKVLSADGWSGSDIARKLGWTNRNGGPNDNKVTKMKAIAEHPECVQEMWCKYALKGNKADVDFLPTGEALEELAKAKARDSVNNYDGPTEHGPYYSKKMADLTKAKGKEKPDHSGKKALKTAYETEHGSLLLRLLFGVLCGEKTDSLSDVTSGFRWMEEQVFGQKGKNPLREPKVIERIRSQLAPAAVEQDETEPETSDTVDETAETELETAETELETSDTVDETAETELETAETELETSEPDAVVVSEGMMVPVGSVEPVVSRSSRRNKKS